MTGTATGMSIRKLGATTADAASGTIGAMAVMQGTYLVAEAAGVYALGRQILGHSEQLHRPRLRGPSSRLDWGITLPVKYEQTLAN